jgi:hypothetical protein
MSDITAVLPAEQAGISVIESEEAQDTEAQDDVQEEKQLSALLRKCENAFCKGNKGLLLSRVECGNYCCQIYVLRAEQGHKDRSFTSQLIFNRLAVHADSKRECDASELAKLYQTVALLGTDNNWKALTVGKLLVLSKLVSRVEGTETYQIFSGTKDHPIAATEVKDLFSWACGEGMEKPSLDDISTKVLTLMDPAKAAEKEAEKAAKAAAKEEGKDAPGDADEDEDEETPATANLISTVSKAEPVNWKDVPEGMVALYKEACKQQPGHAGDVMCDFAKELVWTPGMAKSLIDGIANSKDAESAMRAMQAMVDFIAEEYSVYPQSELEEAA